MKSEIDDVLKEMTFKEVLVKESNQHVLTMLLPEEVPLMLFSKDLKTVFDVTPVGPYYDGKIPADHYVISNFLYRMDRAIPRSYERQFYEMITKTIPEKFDFKLIVDGQMILQTNMARAYNLKLKDILKHRKEEGYEFYNCTCIKTYEPHDKHAVYQFKKVE